MSPLADCLPTFTKVTQTSLPGDTVYGVFSLKNEVLLGRKTNNTMTKYNFSHKKYQMVWEKPAPEEMKYSCSKFISATGDIILCDIEESVTHIYRGDLVLKAIHNFDDMVLQAVGNNRLTYSLYDDDAKTVVDVYTMNQEFVHRMILPKSKSSSSLSVCAVPGSGNIIVIDSENRCLDVFLATGEVNAPTKVWTIFPPPTTYH